MTHYTTKPSSPQEALAHYGKKGMKWGVRKDDTAAAKAAVGRSKPTSNEILDARARMGSKTRAINRQIDKTNLATGKQQKVEAKKLSEMSTKLLKDPDRATSLRMTRGEKTVAALFAVGIPGAGTAGVAAGVGTRVAIRKSIERDIARRNS